MYNTVEVWLDDDEPHAVQGEGAGSLPTGPDNLVRRAMAAVTERAGLELPKLGVRQRNAIPLARGLGSSSAAIIGGCLAADSLLGAPLSRDELLEVAVELEGHPDNVAPALYGGMTVCYAASSGTGCLRFRPANPPRAVVAIPDFEVETESARRALPETVPHADAVLNVGRAAAVVTCFASGSYAPLADALRDRLHQPYRAHLVPGMEEAIAAALDAGAYGAALSGSGPSIVAFTHNREERVAAALREALGNTGAGIRVEVLDICFEGATVAT